MLYVHWCLQAVGEIILGRASSDAPTLAGVLDLWVEQRGHLQHWKQGLERSALDLVAAAVFLLGGDTVTAIDRVLLSAAASRRDILEVPVESKAGGARVESGPPGVCTRGGRDGGVDLGGQMAWEQQRGL